MLQANKITVQLFKLCQAFKTLTKDQKFDVVKTIDTLETGCAGCEYIQADNLEQIESAILEHCEIFLNVDVLKFFVELGKRLGTYHVFSQSDLILKLDKTNLSNKDVTDWSNYRFIEFNHQPFYTCCSISYCWEFIQHVQAYEFIHGLESANIPQWILDIPVTEQELKDYETASNTYAVKKHAGRMYILRKSERDHKTEYTLKVYNKSLKPAYITIQSKQKGLQAECLGAGYVQRVLDLDRQLNLVVFAYETEKERQAKQTA